MKDLKAMAGDDQNKLFQIAMIELQSQIALEQMMIQTISNIEKKKNDTSSAVAQNFK